VLSRIDSFTFAVRNIARWGDTDVFPFPPENHIFHDRQQDAVHLLDDMNRDWRSYIENTPPVAENTLSLITYEGYRWVTQIDPIWNAYFLGLVLRLSPEIEQVRVSASDEVVFSHRMRLDHERASLFVDNAWNNFIERSDLLAHENKYVVTADIADFYGHLYHHRVDNALQDALSERIEEITQIDLLLRKFSGGTSYGLPIGGPAARILSEVTLNRVDQLLLLKGVTFCRYADDYRLFAGSQEEAYRCLYLLTESLLRHEGLSLQKQKTRVLRASDYLRSPLFLPEDSDDLTSAERQERKFLRLSLRFDPYSSTAEDDYERLQTDLQEFDIVQMLTDEVNKSRINTAVVRRLATALRILNRDIQHAAVGTILKSLEMLAPALPVVLRVLSQLFPQLSESTAFCDS
jgi:Reverse transcriptase (RNA-dependent DNA polymerase)